MRRPRPRPRARRERCRPPSRAAPPGTARRSLRAGLRPSDAVVDEAELRHLVGAIDVAQVDQDRLLHRLLDALEIEGAELLPFGDADERVGALGAGVRTV